MSTATDQTVASPPPILRMIRRVVLLASVLLLAFGSAATLTGKPKSFDVDFDKCLDPNIVHAGYLFTFAGPVSGDVSVTVEARVLGLIRGVEPGQTYIAADYVVACRLSPRESAAEWTTGGIWPCFAAISATVRAWLIGAGVHDEFENYVRSDGTPCSRGTLKITPRWK